MPETCKMLYNKPAKNLNTTINKDKDHEYFHQTVTSSAVQLSRRVSHFCVISLYKLLHLHLQYKIKGIKPTIVLAIYRKQLCSALTGSVGKKSYVAPGDTTASS